VLKAVAVWGQSPQIATVIRGPHSHLAPTHDTRTRHFFFCRVGREAAGSFDLAQSKAPELSGTNEGAAAPAQEREETGEVGITDANSAGMCIFGARRF